MTAQDASNADASDAAASKAGAAAETTPSRARSAKRQPIIAPSILAADFAELGAECVAALEAGAEWIHVDVMDGRFVPTITIGPAVCAALRPHIAGFMDVHLMIEPPEPLLEAFATSGADQITIHAESTHHLDRALKTITDLGVKAGVALNPSTPESVIQYVLDHLSLICVMTVNPGAGGQKFLASQLPKLRAIRKMIGRRPIRLMVDGGVDPNTIASCAEAGADVFVAGSAVFKGGGSAQRPFYAERIAALRAQATQTVSGRRRAT